VLSTKGMPAGSRRERGERERGERGRIKVIDGEVEGKIEKQRKSREAKIDGNAEKGRQR
jgi:hypothetical protein